MNIFDQINQDSKDEIIAKRSECSKTFKVSPGNEKLVHFFAPVHYKNDINNSSEGFKDINLEIVEGVDYFEVTQTPYHLKILKILSDLNMSLNVAGRLLSGLNL